MSDKPRDILEFLRRAGREPSTAVVDPLPGIPVVETPVTKGDFSAWMLVKRQQVWIAGVAAGLFAVLTFLIGYAWGSPAATETPAASGVVVHTIQAIAYDATPNGEVRAKSVAAQLRRVVDEEVTVQRLDRHRKILVTVGSWLSNPLANERARALLKQIRALEVDGRDRHPFQSALFYRLER
jgi:hypothetical protein